MAKSKRKFRYVYVDSRGRFVKQGKRGAKRRRVTIRPVVAVFRDKKTGRFGSPGRRNVVKERVGKGRAESTPQVNQLFQRKIVLKTATKKVLEVVYNIPFRLEMAKVKFPGGQFKKKKVFAPSYSDISAVFEFESVEMQHSKKTFHTAVCKANVQFADKDIEWIQIPVGYRIPVDEPGGASKLYEELIKFLNQYAIVGVSVIQLSVLRLPL